MPYALPVSPPPPPPMASPPPPPYGTSLIGQWSFDYNLLDPVGGLDGVAVGPVRHEAGCVVLGNTTYIKTKGLAAPLGARTLVAW